MTTSPTGNRGIALQETSGQALLEVLVAVLVIMIGVVAAGSVTIGAYAAAHRAGQKLSAASRLASEIAALRVQAKVNDGLEPGRWEGNWPEPIGSSWEAVASPAPASPLYYTLTAHARWVREGRPVDMEWATSIAAYQKQEE